LSFAVSTGAHVAAPVMPRSRGSSHLRRIILVLLAYALALALVAIQSPAAVQAGAASDARVVATAKSHVGKRYLFGATGMSRFDCSGLVYRVYQQTGLLNKIGGGRMGVRGYWKWFRNRGLASRSNPKPGDLAIWGNGAHMGIYVGNGKAVSAMVNPWGVTKHPVTGFLTSRFTTYLHVKLGGGSAGDTSTGGQGATAGSGKTVKVIVSALNVRSGPGTNNARLGVVYRGARLPVVQKARDSAGRKWFQVQLSSGRTGWTAGWLTKVVRRD